MERWKTVPGHEKYEVSDTGKVRNKETGRLLSPCNNGDGYKKVHVGKSQREYVHRMVASAFVERREGANEVNHKDGNRSNNNADNLEWVNSSENTKHAVYRGALRPWGNSARAIRSINPETGEVKNFATLSEAEQYYGSRHIVEVLKGRRIHCKGHLFEYMEGGDADANFDYLET